MLLGFLRAERECKVDTMSLNTPKAQKDHSSIMNTCYEQQSQQAVSVGFVWSLPACRYRIAVAANP